MTSAADSNEVYVILGASGNTASIIADFLLSKGEKVRVVGRDVGRLQRFARKGAEAFPADMTMRLRSPKPSPARGRHTRYCRRCTPAKSKSNRAMRLQKA